MLSYLKGDATNPMAKGQKIVVHIVNDTHAWGKGFVMALSKKWPDLREQYLAWRDDSFYLGAVQFVPVANSIVVANMVAQHGIRPGSKGPPIRYSALDLCLQEVAKYAKAHNASVHGPRFGAGLAGGSWEKIEPIILRTLADLDVYIYDFE